MCFSGILVPGGFGLRGTDGKMAAAEWARKKEKPYLGEALFNFLCFFSQTVNFFVLIQLCEIFN